MRPSKAVGGAVHEASQRLKLLSEARREESMRESTVKRVQTTDPSWRLGDLLTGGRRGGRVTRSLMHNSTKYSLLESTVWEVRVPSAPQNTSQSDPPVLDIKRHCLISILDRGAIL